MWNRSDTRPWTGAALLLGLLTAGCGPGYGPAGVEIVARRPPPERVEVRTVSPGVSYVWIRGHYAWRGGDYVWEPGRWEAPPASTRHWEPGHWAHTRNGWYWIEGRWR